METSVAILAFLVSIVLFFGCVGISQNPSNADQIRSPDIQPTFGGDTAPFNLSSGSADSRGSGFDVSFSHSNASEVLEVNESGIISDQDAVGSG